MRPSGSGGAPASAALPLLAKVPPCLRRGALHLPARRSERDPCYDSDRLLTAMTLPPLATTVVGSYSMPEWLKRAKNDYLQRRVSRHDLDEMHDAVRKSAIKDQEIA